jgi:hypothetical protein
MSLSEEAALETARKFLHTKHRELAHPVRDTPYRMPTFAVDPHKLEELLNYCVGFAKQMVESHGAFHPFGAVIVSGGTLNAVGGDVGEEHPRGAAVFQFLQSAMHAQFRKREIIAASIATDVNIPPPLLSPGGQ